MICCLHLREGRGDDNSLLEPEGPDTLAQREDNQSTTEREAFEGATQRIIETIGQLEGFSASSIQHALTDCMNCIPSQHVRLYILSHFLDTLSKTNKLATLQALVSTLDDKQQHELVAIVTGLPPSVLGDSVAKETTRVLVDLLADTKECAQIDKLRIAAQNKFVDTTIEMLQQTLAPLHLAERENVIIGILHTQIPPLKMKITLKYLVFSRCLHPDQSARADFMRQLLSSNVSISL
jgi:hypothetical protein